MKILKKPKVGELKVEITKENYERAVQASEGTCLVADAIRERYKEFSNVKVNVATTRATDKKHGFRYLYLTPPSVSQMLLAFDQGWKEKAFPIIVRIRQLVNVTPIIRSVSNVKIKAEHRATRLAELEAKEQRGETLTHGDRRALGKLRNPKPAPERPTTYGEAIEIRNDAIIGRPPPVRYEKLNPNLLAGQTRHFGAKLAQPSEVFKQAVEEAVKADRAKRKDKKS
jgi:hypothetical protein